MTKTGNKPKTIAQTTKAVTIKTSCFHKAERPIGYLEELIVFIVRPAPLAETTKQKIQARSQIALGAVISVDRITDTLKSKRLVIGCVSV
jgi:hypothetical protein